MSGSTLFKEIYCDKRRCTQERYMPNREEREFLYLRVCVSWAVRDCVHLTVKESLSPYTHTINFA